MAMPNMGCQHKQKEILHYVGSSFRVVDRERKSISCLRQILRENTLDFFFFFF